MLIHLINEQHIFHIHNNLFYFIIFKVRVHLSTKKIRSKTIT